MCPLKPAGVGRYLGDLFGPFSDVEGLSDIVLIVGIYGRRGLQEALEASSMLEVPHGGHSTPTLEESSELSERIIRRWRVSDRFNAKLTKPVNQRIVFPHEHEPASTGAEPTG